MYFLQYNVDKCWSKTLEVMLCISLVDNKQSLIFIKLTFSWLIKISEVNWAISDKINDRALRHTAFLVEGLQAVTVGQQGTDSLSDTLPAHSPAPFIKKAVGHEVRAPLRFHFLKIQTQRAKMVNYICQRTKFVLPQHVIWNKTNILSKATYYIITENKLFKFNSSSGVSDQCSNTET